MVNVYLKKGRDRSVLQGNPWIFSGSIDHVDGRVTSGDRCMVFSAKGTVLGCGYINPASAITVRILQWGSSDFNEDNLSARIRSAVDRRRTIFSSDTDSCRLINSEGDFLPGLIVDKFSEGIVIQIQTAGMERMRSAIIAALGTTCTPQFIFERSDTESRAREGLPAADGLLSGRLPESLLIRENGLTFHADISGGQKTGFFFDQRRNRRLLSRYADNRSICDCFCYNGPFSVYALSGGARHVEAVDQSESALRQVHANAAANGFSPEKITVRQADIFTYLRQTDQRYDCIILDPPKFARHPGEVERASRGYKDINLCACKKIAPGGVIFTFSCSHAIDVKLFRQIVFSAAADSGRRFQLLHTLSAGPDHPINLAHREGEYLKGLVLQAE